MSKRGWIAAICVTLLLAGWVAAQTTYIYRSPYAAFNFIPNFTGNGAGAALLNAINDRFSGAQPSSARLKTLSFTQLPAERDGWSFWCRDCALTNPCAGKGSGATARGESGRYNCAASAVGSGPVAATTLTGSGAGDGSNSITRMNWDSILTPSTFATTAHPFHKARVDRHAIVVKHGGTAVTDANGLWTSADVSSLINLYWGYSPMGDGKWANNGLSGAATVFTGCIAAVNSPGHITLGTIQSGVCSTVGVAYRGPTMDAVHFPGNAIWGPDAAPTINRTIASVGDTTTARAVAIHIPSGYYMIGSHLRFENKSPWLFGNGLANIDNLTGSGTGFIYAGPANDDLIEMSCSRMAQVEGLALIGNDLPTNRPRAIIETDQFTRGCVLDNSFNAFKRLEIGSGGSIGMPGGLNGPTARHGFLALKASTQDDRQYVEDSEITHVGTCFTLGQSQAVEWQFQHSSCTESGAVFDGDSGGDITVDLLEVLDSGPIFLLANGFRAEGRSLTGEGDRGPVVGMPWEARRLVGIDHEIFDANGNFERALAAGITSATAPRFSTTALGETRDGTVNWQNRGTWRLDVKKPLANTLYTVALQGVTIGFTSSSSPGTSTDAISSAIATGIRNAINANRTVNRVASATVDIDHTIVLASRIAPSNGYRYAISAPVVSRNLAFSTGSYPLLASFGGGNAPESYLHLLHGFYAGLAGPWQVPNQHSAGHGYDVAVVSPGAAANLSMIDSNLIPSNVVPGAGLARGVFDFTGARPGTLTMERVVNFAPQTDVIVAPPVVGGDSSIVTYLASEPAPGSYNGVIGSSKYYSKMWNVIVNGDPPKDWRAFTVVSAGRLIRPVLNNAGQFTYKSSSSGTTGSSPPAWVQGEGASTAADGTVIWQNVGRLYGPDSTRADIVGRLNVLGGPITLTNLDAPILFSGTCSDAGTGFRYRYYLIPMSRGNPANRSAELTVTCRSAIGSIGSKNALSTIALQWFPTSTEGEDSYSVWRTAVGGASGTEKLVTSISAGMAADYPAGIQGLGYRDETEDSSLISATLPGAKPVLGTGSLVLGSFLQLGTVQFANLPASGYGSAEWTVLGCTDCDGPQDHITEGSACASTSGKKHHAVAIHINGIWRCY